MKELHELRQLLCQEARELAKRRELNASDLDHVFKITESIKAIDKIECMESGGSYDGGSYNGGSYDRGSYDGTSGRRSRDSMGRFSGDYTMDGSYTVRGGRGTQSWDSARDNMMRHLDEMEGMASTNREKEVIRRAREELKEM